MDTYWHTRSDKQINKHTCGQIRPLLASKARNFRHTLHEICNNFVYFVFFNEILNSLREPTGGRAKAN